MCQEQETDMIRLDELKSDSLTPHPVSPSDALPELAALLKQTMNILGRRRRPFP